MLIAFAVFDQKAAAYWEPQFCTTRGVMLRLFSDTVMNPQGSMARHPEDYSLHEIGEYEPNSGKMTPLDQPKFLCSASQVLSQVVAARTGPKVQSVLEEVSK